MNTTPISTDTKEAFATKQKMLDLLPDKLVLFDGVCNLCNATIQQIIKHDTQKQYKFAALQSETGKAVLDFLGKPLQTYDTFVLYEHGNFYTRSTAGVRVWAGLGGLWKVLYVLLLIPPFLRDIVYNFIAQWRYRIWGRKASCMVPSPELQSRFLK